MAGEEAIGAVDSSVRSDEVGGERGPDGGGGGVHGSDRGCGSRRRGQCQHGLVECEARSCCSNLHGVTGVSETLRERRRKWRCDEGARLLNGWPWVGLIGLRPS